MLLMRLDCGCEVVLHRGELCAMPTGIRLAEAAVAASDGHKCRRSDARR